MLNRQWYDALLDFSPTRLKLKTTNHVHKSFLADLDNGNETDNINLVNIKHLELEDKQTSLYKAKFYRKSVVWL